MGTKDSGMRIILVSRLKNLNRCVKKVANPEYLPQYNPDAIEVSHVLPLIIANLEVQKRQSLTAN